MPYLLSQDKRLEIGWIYRVIPHDSGRVDLINELGGSCGAPDVHDCDLTQWHTVPLSEPEYHQLYTNYAIASDASLTAAHQLIDQLIAPMPDPHPDPTVRPLHIWHGPEGQAHARTTPPFGPGFAQSLVDSATRLEAWGTTFHHASEDFVEFRLWQHEHLLATRKIPGY